MTRTDLEGLRDPHLQVGRPSRSSTSSVTPDEELTLVDIMADPDERGRRRSSSSASCTPYLRDAIASSRAAPGDRARVLHRGAHVRGLAAFLDEVPRHDHPSDGIAEVGVQLGAASAPHRSPFVEVTMIIPWLFSSSEDAQAKDLAASAIAQSFGIGQIHASAVSSLSRFDLAGLTMNLFLCASYLILRPGRHS